MSVCIMSVNCIEFFFFQDQGGPMYFNTCELQLGPCLPHKLPLSDCFSYASVLSVLQSGCGPSHLPQDLSTCCSLCLKFHSLLPLPGQIPLFNASPFFQISLLRIKQHINQTEHSERCCYMAPVTKYFIIQNHF